MFTSGLDMRHHLETNNSCMLYYEKILKCSDIHAIVFSSFGCLNCDLKKGKHLRVHLEEVVICQNYFKEVLVKDSLEEIMKLIYNIKRKLFKSRSKRQRTTESEKLGLKRFGLKQFVKETQLGPSRLKCEICQTVGSRRQICVKFVAGKQSSLCAQCSNVQPHQNLPVDPFLPDIGFSAVNGFGVITPEPGNPDDLEQFVGVLLPCCIISDYSQFRRSPESQKHLVKDMYKGVMNFKDHYSNIYENECKKIKSASEFNYVQPGLITNLTRKEVILHNSLSNTSRIPGTDDYHDRARSNLLQVVNQAGPVFFVTELHMKNFSLQIFATQLKIRNMFKLDIVDEEDETTTYLVHNHRPNVECPEDCEVRDLVDFLNGNENPEETVSLGTIANYIHNFLRQFVSKIMTDPDSVLCSEFYDSTFQFSLENQLNSKALIATWPKFLRRFNMKIAAKENISKADIEALLDFVDNTVTTATDPEILQSWFDLDSTTADKVSSYATLHQLKIEVDKCDHLPAQVSLMKCESKLPKLKQQVLTKQYRAFLGSMEATLVCTENLSIEVNTWLYQIESDEGFQLVQDGENIILTLPDQLPMSFIYEQDIIVQLMVSHGCTQFSALYHRALTFTTISSLGVVLRSGSLLDAHVKPYHPAYLLASGSTVTSYFIGDGQLAAINKLKKSGDELVVDEDHPLKPYEGTHKIVHLMEACFRFDRTKKFTFSNVLPVFVHIQKKGSLKFVKAVGNDHSSHFKERNKNNWLQIFKSNLDRFYEIPEDISVMCPFDFIRWYVQKKSNGEDLVDDDGYGDADDGEIDGEGEVDDENNNINQPRMALCNDDWTGVPVFLPEVIMTTGQEVFRRRSNPTFISYPITSETEQDIQYREVVLFKTHQKKEELENMSEEEIEAAWKEQDVFPDIDGQGHPMTKIQTVKRKILNSMCDANLGSVVENSEFVKIYFET